MIELTKSEEVLRNVLIGFITKNQLTTYKEVEDATGIPRRSQGYALGRVAEYDFQNGLPMTPSIVCSKDTGHPSWGYYVKASEINKFSGRGYEAKMKFWVSELHRCYQAFIK